MNLTVLFFLEARKLGRCIKTISAFISKKLAVHKSFHQRITSNELATNRYDLATEWQPTNQPIDYIYRNVLIGA